MSHPRRSSTRHHSGREKNSGTGTPGKVESGPVPNSKTALLIGVAAVTPAVVKLNVPVF